jgi:hypothetical protein
MDSVLKAGISRTAPLTIVCDDTSIARAVAAAGWQDVRDLAHSNAWPAHPIQHAVLLCADWTTPMDPRLADVLHSCTVLHVPLFAFDATPPVAVYTMEMLRLSDFSKAVERNRATVAFLGREPSYRFTGRNGQATDLECILADDIVVATALTAEMKTGVATPLGIFFEVEMECDEAQRRAFRVSGSLDVDGVLCAVAENFAGDPGPARAVAARVQAAARPGGLRLVIEDNVVVSCTTPAGRSCLPELTEVFGDDLGLSEFAIGTNRLPRPDFSLNAQVNEGAGGIHVGLGGGAAMVHMDFVSLHARPAPLPC